MDIFDFAMKMEKDGEQYYRELASKSKNKGVTNILTMMADEEVKHYNLMQRMKSESPDIGDTEILKNVRNVFENMKDGGDKFDFDSNQKDLYKKAQKLEKQSEDFYKSKSNQVDDDKKKAAFLKIADEENRHYRILQNLIDFVAKPETYLEDAEFSNLEEF